MILSEITQTHSDLTIDLKQILQLPRPRPYSETLRNTKCCFQNSQFVHVDQSQFQAQYLLRDLDRGSRRRCSSLARAGGIARLCGVGRAEERLARKAASCCQFGRELRSCLGLGWLGLSTTPGTGHLQGWILTSFCVICRLLKYTHVATEKSKIVHKIYFSILRIHPCLLLSALLQVKA